MSPDTEVIRVARLVNSTKELVKASLGIVSIAHSRCDEDLKRLSRDLCRNVYLICARYESLSGIPLKNFGIGTTMSEVEQAAQVDV